MKISFEGTTYQNVLDQMEEVLAASNASRKIAAKAQGPGPEPAPPAPAPVDKPVSKPVEDLFAEQGQPAPAKAKDPAKVAAMNKARAAKDAKKAAAATPEPAPPPPPKTAEGMDPAEVVKVRQKTIEDLQSAYANGFQKEVFELLSRFGNGAKSFRELPPDAFVPIREAIDNGALT